MDRLKICSWNANGLRSRVGELIEYLDRTKIDILLLNETKYTSKDKIKIKNYICYRKERENSAGGVAVLVRNNIPHKLIKFDSNMSLEAIGISLLSDINLIAVYRRPNIVLTHQDIEKLMNTGNKVLIVGDLNATHLTWNCNRNNKSGRILLNYAQNNNCTILYPNEPTNYPPNNTTPSTIDIALNKNVRNISELEVQHELSSDHNPILFYLGAQHKTHKTKRLYIYEDADWERFRKLINDRVQITPNISSTHGIDKEVQKLTNNINYCIQQTVPTKDLTSINDRLPCEILQLIRNRNKLRKRWQRTRMAQDKADYYKLNRNIKKKIFEHRNKKWNKQLQKLNPKDNSLWRMTKILKTEYHSVPTLEKSGYEAITAQEKANLLATQFEEVHNIDLTNNTKQQESVIQTVKNYLENTTTLDAYKYYTNPKELAEEIKKLPSRKAPGTDNIQNIILKNIPKKAIVQIMYIINASLKLAHFTTHWKTGLITPILKPGKKGSEPSSYRPISLLCTLSKLTEKIILKRLNTFENKQNIIIDEQFGFRQKHNTVQQVTRIVNDISTNFNRSKVTVMALLDIEKAFDKVWTDAVIHKMILYKYPPELIKFIHSYLQNRHLIVTIEGDKSTKRKARAGVPQGSVLGPKLFIIFINDIPKYPKTNTALFADDLAIYAHSFSAIVAAKQLQTHIYILERYYRDWKIIVNKAKTEVIVLTRRKTGIKIFQPITVYGHPTTPVHTVKYLGVHLDSKLTYHMHIKHIIRKTYSVIKKIYPLMVNNSTLSANNKKLIYKMLLRPIITYAAPVWCSVAKSHMKHLQKLQNKCLRMILSVNTFTPINHLHEEAEIELIGDYIKSLAERFYQSHLKCNKLLYNITSIRSYNLPFEYKHKLPYDNLLIFNMYKD